MLQPMGSQGVRRDLMTEQQRQHFFLKYLCFGIDLKTL